MSNFGKKRAFALIVSSIVLSAICISVAGCFPLVSKEFWNALDISKVSNRKIVCGDKDPLSVTFEGGRMYAQWDVEPGFVYGLSVRLGEDEKPIPAKGGRADLTACGYSYDQNLLLSLSCEKPNDPASKSARSFAYSAMTASDYAKYARKVDAGFEDIDYYMANRREFFEFWSYLIAFREGCRKVEGCYDLDCDIRMAYDYRGSYGNATDAGKAFTYEAYSAVDAYEDSAAYKYSVSVDDSGKNAQISMKFLYPADPKYETRTRLKYRNAIDDREKPHYRPQADKLDEIASSRKSGAPSARWFKIDGKPTVRVSSGEQLYFALKKGYRPVPEGGSNAEKLWGRMRDILSVLIADADSDATKAHHIYDYLANTVLYDYDFANMCREQDGPMGIKNAFEYRCMYLEGVFGLGDSGFNTDSRVAICDGFGKAYLCLATIEGLECRKISGKVSDGKRSEQHAWNKVKIDGRWYLVDVTWGNKLEDDAFVAPGGRIPEYLVHEYLLVGDNSRHEESEYHTYPKAESGRLRLDGVDNNSSIFGYYWFSREFKYAGKREEAVEYSA